MKPMDCSFTQMMSVRDTRVSALRRCASRPIHWTRSGIRRTLALLLPLLTLALSAPAHASIAYGSINNFDTVNDTGSVCHGFEIEIDDIHSKDITYTYDYNHYNVPKITEDNTDPLHPKVFVRYQSAKNADGTWASYTAIPAGPIPPTAGHQFTNPSLNFGGEHFGVGFYGTPTAIKYSWLKDDGAGNLVFAGAVNISTPAFTYFPPVAAAPAQVQAVIVPPPPPAPPVFQFGDASWVKEIKTTTHNAKEVRLEDLVGDDPGKPQPWANGEPDEVETEWRVLQTEFAAGNGGKNGELQGAPEDLPGGDEIITRRYEFFKYVGPIDAESGEAVADTVGAADPDGVHYFGSGSVTYNDHIDPATGEWVTVTVDLSTVWVVGEFVGAQMAGFDAEGKIGLIDHVQDGEKNAAYVERSIIIGGAAPIVTTTTGALPDGMSFDEVTGVLSGTPTVSGTFTFTVHSTDARGGDVTTTYTLTIVDPVVVQSTVTTSASPVNGGSVSGNGDYLNGADVTVIATANPGFTFVNWTEGGAAVSASPSYTFTANGNRALVANFVQTTDVTGQITVSRGGFRFNRATGRFVQTVKLTNKGGAITGPVSLVLDSLSANVSLFKNTGVTSIFTPAGSPYINVAPGNLAAGASVTVTLEFTNPTKAAIHYSTRALTGPGSR